MKPKGSQTKRKNFGCHAICTEHWVPLVYDVDPFDPIKAFVVYFQAE